MIPRRNEEGWRYLGPFQWKVEREDNHGDQSTTTRVSTIWRCRFSCHVEFTRGWAE